MVRLQVRGIDERLIKGISELESWLEFENTADGTIVNCQKSDHLSIELIDGRYYVTYSVEVEIFKALALIVKQNETNYHKHRSIEVMSFMIDSSRNAVRNLATLKKVIRYLAILGFNELQIYTEDTYEVEEEPYFGTFRGKYSKAELQEIVDYADMFAIEVVPCIQTLAHLNAITYKPHYYDMWDCNDILLVDSEKTYTFIENLFKTLRSVFKSNKINVGLDEAHMLGLGRFLDEHGFQDRYAIFVRHLNRVNEIAKKYQFDAMLWSDMFFRIGSKGNYYGDGKIEQSVIDDVPTNMTLCYWDYDHTTQSEYRRMFNRHKLFNNKIRFTTATWNWMGLAPNYKRTDLVVKAAIKACKEAHVAEYMLTSWGDNGSESSFLTSIPTLFDSTAMIYDENLNELFKALFNISINQFKKIDLINRADINGHYVVNPGKYLLYNDYLCGMFDCHTDDTYPVFYASVARKMNLLAKKVTEGKYYFETLASLAEILSLKSYLGVNLREAYQKKDDDTLRNCLLDMQKILSLMETFIQKFRKQWYLENKSYGFDVQEMRLGGLKERTKSCIETLENYLNGNILQIDELKEKTLPYLEDRVGKDIFMNFYNRMISHNVY